MTIYPPVDIFLEHVDIRSCCGLPRQLSPNVLNKWLQASCKPSSSTRCENFLALSLVLATVYPVKVIVLAMIPRLKKHLTKN